MANKNYVLKLKINSDILYKFDRKCEQNNTTINRVVKNLILKLIKTLPNAKYIPSLWIYNRKNPIRINGECEYYIINFMISKEEKDEFIKICKDRNINKSQIIRDYISMYYLEDDTVDTECEIKVLLDKLVSE